MDGREIRRTLAPHHDGPAEDLDTVECRRLLGSARIGRLGFTDGAMPAIVPVRFAVDGDAVLIPAHPDGALVRGVRGSIVVLQVDSYCDALGPGWSVTVVGPARVLADARSVARIDDLGLFARRPTGDGGCYVSVHLGLLRGRRTARTSSLAASSVDDPVPEY